MKAAHFLTIAGFLLCFELHAQVQVYYGPGIEEHVENYRQQAAKTKTKGFRVQLLSLNGPKAKDEVQQARQLFIKSWPEHAAYVTWDAPNWKLRVGDFRTRLDATLFWKQIYTHFPQSYVVMDEVKPRQEK